MPKATSHTITPISPGSEDEGSLPRFIERLDAVADKSAISFWFIDISALGARADRKLYADLLKFPEIGLCPGEQADPMVDDTLKMISIASSLLKEHRHVALFGAAAMQLNRRRKPLENVEKRICASLKAVVEKRSNKTRAIIIPFNASEFDYDFKNSIIAYIRDFVQKDENVRGHISYNNWRIKPDFSNFTAEVRQASREKAQELVNVAFQAVWDNVHQRLDATMQSALDKVEDSKKQHICSLLAKGFLEGSTRDRPWDIDKVAEEARKRILSALVREIVPAYSSLDSVPVEEYIDGHIRPYFEKFSLPNNVLHLASPMASVAKYPRKTA